jgi:amino acid transporter
VLITSFYGLLVALASVVVAIAGLLLTQRLIPLSLRERHNDTTGIIYAALYVMFGVTIGFSLFSVWQQYNTARQVVHSEAAAVEQVYRLAERFPEPDRTQIQELAISYARGTVDEEWSLMREGRSSPRVEANLDELRQSVQHYEPHTDAQDALYAAALSAVDELEEDREFRLVAVNEGIPYIVWVVLVVGGVLTIAFTYLFGMENVWLHAVAVAGLTILVSLILHAIGVLDYPFNSSGVRVQPDAFEQVLREIGGKGGS